MNIYDVSKKAGVSIATVSRVLNGNANVSDKTKNKVLVAMKELDYTPNIFARGLGLNTMILLIPTLPMRFIIWSRNCAGTITIPFCAVPDRIPKPRKSIWIY